MFTYEYYCEAFPVRNQVCGFWEVLITQGLAVGKKWGFLAPELSWLFADRWKNSEFNCTVVISLSHLLWKPLPGRRGSQPQSALGGFIVCHICPALVAVPECDSSVLPSQSPWLQGDLGT